MKRWPSRSAWIGWDPREADAYAVARSSMRRHLVGPMSINGLILGDLMQSGLYTRPTQTNGGRLFDLLSARGDYDGALSTQHANARFLLPHIAGSDLALFVDGDILVRGNVGALFDIAEADPSKAVWCVKHDYRPTETVKMDGCVQTQYSRKNWSSVMLWNLVHPATKRLTVEIANTLPGRDLHALAWLADEEIGELGPEWNHLVGEAAPNPRAKIVHFTKGTPSMGPAYADCEYAAEWFAELRRWAS